MTRYPTEEITLPIGCPPPIGCPSNYQYLTFKYGQFFTYNAVIPMNLLLLYHWDHEVIRIYSDTLIIAKGLTRWKEPLIMTLYSYIERALPALGIFFQIRYNDDPLIPSLPPFLGIVFRYDQFTMDWITSEFLLESDYIKRCVWKWLGDNYHLLCNKIMLTFPTLSDYL